MKTSAWRRAVRPRSWRAAAASLALVAAGLLTVSAQALAAKQAVDFLGGGGALGGQFTQSSGVAVNYTGAGGVPIGTIYATDGGGFGPGSTRGNRVERFQRNDNGTSTDATDDTYSFVSAWGAGVETGGTNYQICAVAINCGRAIGTGGNGTLAGDGALNKPGGVAVDQDTGDVYVADSSSRRSADNNFRVSVYSATGAFLRSFGWDVVESGPDDNGVGYEVCKADIDVCKAGLTGEGVGQIGALANGERAAEGIAVSAPDGNPATGSVFLADSFNRRVNTYNLDGSSPVSIGSAATFEASQPQLLAVDSRGVLYASNSKNGNELERYDTENANGGGVGFLAPIAAPVDEAQELKLKATAGQFTLSLGADTTPDLPFDVKAEQLRAALAALPSIGGIQNVQVSVENPWTITFTGAFAAKDVDELVVGPGTTPLSGGLGASVKTTVESMDGPLERGPTEGLAIDPDGDGAGPATDVLYVLRGGNPGVVQQFGPLSPPGLATPPGAVDEKHGTAYPYTRARGLAIEPPTGRLYVPAFDSALGEGVFVLDAEGPPPAATLDSLSGITSRSVVAHATIDPNGPPNTSYRFEYSTDQTNWIQVPTVVLGHQEDPQSVQETIGVGAGLHPSTHYYVRLIAGRRFGTPITTPALEFTTASSAPIVETTGSPLRTTTSAQLNGRVTPSNATTEYHFEYGAEGPCDASPCETTEPQPVGPGDTLVLVSQEIEGLQPDTTYHYRLIAGNASGPATGADMTVTTRASDAPLSHGRFPGPPGSDRAYEQVSLPDTGGNPVNYATSVSNDGDRAFYQVSGGTPISSTGTTVNQLFAERTASGWHSRDISPQREQQVGANWSEPAGLSDLSDQIALNTSSTGGGSALWRLRPGAAAAKAFEVGPGVEIGPASVSEDASRVLVKMAGSQDPAHPVAASSVNVYDVSSGSPHLVGLLPGGAVSACGSQAGAGGSANYGPRAKRWVTPDGSLAFFESCGDLYMRDFEAEQSKLIGSGSFLKWTPGAVFFTSQKSLGAGDTGGNDVYRYGIGDEALECVTCVVAGLDAEVPDNAIAVAADGSRVYFRSSVPLVPGAASQGVYRASVGDGNLAYVAPGSSSDIGENASSGEALSPDGSALVFASQDPGLNALGGQKNGGTKQFYRYDDRDRSLTCLSCPQDASAPAAALGGTSLVVAPEGAGANRTALSADGATFAFATPNALLPADQNTARPGQNTRVGTDVYEWRDGRLLLISDGLTDWGDSGPQVTAVTPSGHDIFFAAATQYTQDALDGYRRLYDARIGGGFVVPPPTKPCPLEVCQGTPKGAPEEQAPGTGSFAGPGNAKPHVQRKRTKHHKKKSQHKRKSRHQAKHNRRAAR